MNDGLKNTNGADNPMLPAVVDRVTWQARIDQLRVKEKAHTCAGDTLAAERRRLPRVEVDPTTTHITSSRTDMCQPSSKGGNRWVD
jgi:predicted dithiol-disulfide oxidoreductase (DUF899 family)